MTNVTAAAADSVQQARQKGLTPAQSAEAERVTANADGVQSSVGVDQAATQAASSASANLQAKVSAYAYKTANAKVCQEIDMALGGPQASGQYWHDQVYAQVQSDLGQTLSPALVQTIAQSVASLVQDQANRINAFIDANPANPSDDLKAALAYYNCLPSS